MNKYSSQYCGNKGSLMLIFVVSLRWNAQERLGCPMPEVPSEYLQRWLFIWEIMHSMPSCQQIARGLYLAEQLHLWSWSSGQFDWEPCLASALSTWENNVFGHVFPPKKCLIFQSGEDVTCSKVLYQSRALDLWDKVRKCGCPKDEAKSSDICVKCQELFLNCSKPGAEVHSASPLPNYTRLGNESRAYKCLPPASRCNANLSDALSQVKGVSNEGFCCQYIDVSMFRCFMDIV